MDFQWCYLSSFWHYSTTRRTILKVRPGNDDYVGSLIIEKGKLIAEGTESEPIIFTDIDDQLKALDSSNRSDLIEENGWNLICGSAPAKVTPSYLANYSINGRTITNYGGSVENDNRYNEWCLHKTFRKTNKRLGWFNGLTLAGVGRGSSIKTLRYLVLMDGLMFNVENLI